MKLEAGKFYKTRDGRKAYVAGVSPFDSTDPMYCVAGFIDGNNYDTQWNSAGRYDDGKDSDDLIAEWVEPKRIKGWLNFWDGDSGFYPSSRVFASRKEADEHALGILSERAACIEIDCLEGEGL